jgi:hypothetical protein
MEIAAVITLRSMQIPWNLFHPCSSFTPAFSDKEYQQAATDLVLQYINKYKYNKFLEYMEKSYCKIYKWNSFLKSILSLISESGCPLVFYTKQKRNIKQ